VRTFTVERSEPLDEEAFADWLKDLLASRGEDILRITGIVHFDGQASPRLVQSFRHFHPEPVMLHSWPLEDLHSRLAFITRGVELHAIERSLEAFCGKRSRAATVSSC
jgi:G3E family GTPase